MSPPLEERVGLVAGLAAASLILLRLSLLPFSDPLWGINPLFYLKTGAAMVWTLPPLLVLAPFLVRRGLEPGWQREQKPVPPWAVGAAFFLFSYPLLPSVATPLLGDGVDRIEAVLAGWKGLAGQPAPLDLSLHLIAYRLASVFKGEGWNVAWWSWGMTSYLAGGLAIAAVWSLASAIAANRGGRAFIFFVTLAGGTALFFFGYPENYVTTAAALYWFYRLFLRVARGQARVGWLWPALSGLIALHYFMALLLPPLVFSLYRYRIWRPSTGFMALAGAALTGFAVFVLVVIRDHYGGLAAIFVPPAQWLGGYHLLGLFNQHFLACPGWPLLLPLALAGRGQTAAAPGGGRAGVDVLLSFLGMSSLVLLVFFFFLRPVIGPGPDWDLFSLPSLAYVPWLVLRVWSRWEGTRAWVRVGWSCMVLTAAFTGPWLAVNSVESTSIGRYRDLLEWESGHNPWAASYGYLRLGKYLGRRKFDPRNPEIVGSLKRAVAINPHSATLRLQVAKALADVGHPQLAAAEMAAHFRLQGEYFERKGRVAEALEQYSQWAAARPGDPAAAEAYARVCRQLTPTAPCRPESADPTLPRPPG